MVLGSGAVKVYFLPHSLLYKISSNCILNNRDYLNEFGIPECIKMYRCPRLLNKI